jgi:transposase InsO family protein
MLEKLIERDYSIHIPHNTIQVLLKHDLVEGDMNKKKRRKWPRKRAFNVYVAGRLEKACDR